MGIRGTHENGGGPGRAWDYGFTLLGAGMTTKSNLVMHVITGLGTGGAEAMLWKLIRSSDNKNFPA